MLSRRNANTAVYFTENADHMITGFTCFGHSGYAQKGNDIVCASISALVINANNSLEKIAHVGTDVNQDEENASLAVRICSEPNIQTETIFRSLILGLEEISKTYGGKYCKVTIKEEVPC